MLTFEAATPRAPRLCRVLLFGSGAVGKSPLAIQVCIKRKTPTHPANYHTSSLSFHIILRAPSMTQPLKTTTRSDVWLTKSWSIYTSPTSLDSLTIQSYGNHTFVPAIVSCSSMISPQPIRFERSARSRSTSVRSGLINTFRSS